MWVAMGTCGWCSPAVNDKVVVADDATVLAAETEWSSLLKHPTVILVCSGL